MTIDMPTDAQHLLMDVDELDFVNEDNTNGVQLDTGVEYDADIGRDPVSNVLMVSLCRNNEPLLYNEKGKLKFKLSPLASHNIAFLTEPHHYELYTVKLPRVDTSQEFVHYVSKLFEIYKNLGDDRIYSVPTIGVINTLDTKEHTSAVNLAVEALVVELELFIDSIKDKKNAFTRFFELEESLTILNCLKMIHFTMDTPSEQGMRGVFINGLLSWINRSDGEPNEEYIEQVFASTTNDRKLYQLPFFWKLLNQLLLRGLFDQAIACIERSELQAYLEGRCEVSANAVHDIIALLKQYPIDSSHTFREWKTLVLELAQTFSNSTTQISGELRDFLEDTLLLVGGDHSKILHYSKTWYEAFCGFFLFYIPSLELSEEYLQLSLEKHSLDVTNSWEQACVDIIKGKVYSILPTLESLDTCTAAFSAAFCEAKGLLENYYDEDKNDTWYDGVEDLFSSRNGMACYMLNNFAFELCSHEDKTLWPIAIGLITLSPIGTTSAKKMAIVELLPHYPFKTNDDIEWMLSICAKWRLPEVAKTIYITLGNKLLYESNTIEAMANFSKAGKFDWVKRYSWMMFEASALQGCPLDDIVLNAIVSDSDKLVIPKEILDSLVTGAMKQTLAPYAVLYQFYDAKSNEQWQEALQLLLALIEFTYLPKCYMILLVARFLYPLFLEDPLKVMSEETILRILEAMENRWDDADEKSQNIYLSLREMDNDNSKKLPDEMETLHKLMRTRLNFKLCQEYM